jgi:hypothetical protein
VSRPASVSALVYTPTPAKELSNNNLGRVLRAIGWGPARVAMQINAECYAPCCVQEKQGEASLRRWRSWWRRWEGAAVTCGSSSPWLSSTNHWPSGACSSWSLDPRNLIGGACHVTSSSTNPQAPFTTSPHAVSFSTNRMTRISPILLTALILTNPMQRLIGWGGILNIYWKLACSQTSPSRTAMLMLWVAVTESFLHLDCIQLFHR